MIRTVRAYNRFYVEYEGSVAELADEYAAILQGLLGNDDMNMLVLEKTLEIIEDDKALKLQKLDELKKEKENK